MAEKMQVSPDRPDVHSNYGLYTVRLVGQFFNVPELHVADCYEVDAQERSWTPSWWDDYGDMWDAYGDL
jgi:hypothetical protein